MKKTIFNLLFVFFFVFNVKAQDYVPMAVEGAQWVIYLYDNDGYPPFTDLYFGYRIEGDITINGLDYKKVYRRDFIPVNPNTNYPQEPPFTIENEVLYGAIRDDVVNRKVYGYIFCNNSYSSNCNCGEDYLMYDFDMNVNDTFSNDNCMFFAGENLYIGEIQHIDFENENRVVQVIYYGAGVDTGFIRLYEGMGSNAGLFEPICYFECNLNSTHFQLVNYCVDSNQECINNFLLGNENISFMNTITIAPNPVKDVLVIKTQMEKQYSIELFNFLGKRLLRKQFYGNELSVDMNNYSKGIYYLRVNNHFYKIIKQ